MEHSARSVADHQLNSLALLQMSSTLNQLRFPSNGWALYTNKHVKYKQKEIVKMLYLFILVRDICEEVMIVGSGTCIVFIIFIVIIKKYFIMGLIIVQSLKKIYNRRILHVYIFFVIRFMNGTTSCIIYYKFIVIKIFDVTFRDNLLV